VFENRALSRIFGSRGFRSQGVGENSTRVVSWSLFLTHYCAADKIEKNEMGAACSAYGEGTGGCRVLVRKPEGKRPMERPRCRWEDNIKANFQGLGYGGTD
jgi:hypothetical protein